MNQPLLSLVSRTRRTPFSNRVDASGVKSYTVYNHTLLSTSFISAEEDCYHLKKAVQVWDVSCQKQVELIGKDSEKLLQMTTPRDLKRMQDDQCFYIPMVDEQGMMLNDPVVIKLSSNRFWVSISDTDMLYYFKGLATGLNLDVKVFEPDVYPIAIQGPLANNLIKNFIGEEYIKTKFFSFKKFSFNNKKMIIARSGWSKQGGFEIYLDGFENGEALWDELFIAGKELDVRAGCPNGIERIEGGLLSFGNDITIDFDVYESSLGKFCLATEALKKKSSPKRMLKPIEIDGEPITLFNQWWDLKDINNNNKVGSITSGIWSPDFNTNIAIGMVDKNYWNTENLLIAVSPQGNRKVKVREQYWI